MFYPKEAQLIERPPGNLKGIIWRLKDEAFNLKEDIRNNILIKHRDRGVLSAILLGDKSLILDEEKDLFIKNEKNTRDFSHEMNFHTIVSI